MAGTAVATLELIGAAGLALEAPGLQRMLADWLGGPSLRLDLHLPLSILFPLLFLFLFLPDPDSLPLSLVSSLSGLRSFPNFPRPLTAAALAGDFSQGVTGHRL